MNTRRRMALLGEKAIILVKGKKFNGRERRSRVVLENKLKTKYPRCNL